MSDGPAYSMQGVVEARAAQLAGVARSTLQGWERERFLELPEDGVFRERHVLELLFAGALREVLPLSEAKNLWRRLRATGKLGEFLDLAEQVTDEKDQLDLVIDVDLGRVSFACNAKSLVAAVREQHRARTVHISPLGPRVAWAREGFSQFASAELAGKPRRGRPAKGRTGAIGAVGRPGEPR